MTAAASHPDRPAGTSAESTAPDLTTDICGVSLPHPVLNASGTFDAIAAQRVFGTDLLERFPFSAFVSKTITPEARVGNPPPRLWETPGGMINSIGLPNKGLDGFVEDDLPGLVALPVPLIVSVMGSSAEEFTRMISRLDLVDGVAGFELNVSCPNVHSGLIVGEQPSETEALLTALRPVTSRPLIVKLTPNVADPSSVAAAAERGGVDAVSLINTIKATGIDPVSLRPSLGAGRGGLSGPAVRSVALEQLRSVSAAVQIPIIGMGGIATGQDALEFLASGATAIAVGTQNFRDPMAAERVRSGLAAELASRGIERLSDLAKTPA